MEDYFYERFKHKSKSDLKYIIENPQTYRTEAIEAADKLLREREGLPEKQIDDYKREQSVNEHKHHNPWEDSLSIASFSQSLSYNDLLTYLSLSLFSVAFVELLYYLLSDSEIEQAYKTIRNIGLVFILLLNHVVYKIGHGQSNKFMGRSLNTLILIFSMFLIRITYLYISSANSFSYETDLSSAFWFLVFLIIAIFAFELVVSLLKYGLKFLKWHIL
jgi:hypothetical protein